MRALGYMYKRVERRSEWLEAPGVVDIYSLSGCISEYFADYIKFWRHNGNWLFDSRASMTEFAAERQISLDGLKLFYYEAYELEYDETKSSWVPWEPYDAIATQVEEPSRKKLEGFDIATYSMHSSPECSPLSCNSCAETVHTNEHCLLESFDSAKLILESGGLGACEPGPYRIIAVYTVNDA